MKVKLLNLFKSFLLLLIGFLCGSVFFIENRAASSPSTDLREPANESHSARNLSEIIFQNLKKMNVKDCPKSLSIQYRGQAADNTELSLLLKEELNKKIKSGNFCKKSGSFTLQLEVFPTNGALETEVAELIFQSALVDQKSQNHFGEFSFDAKIKSSWLSLRNPSESK